MVMIMNMMTIDNDDDVHGDDGDDDALFFPLLGLGLNINGQEMT